jgi:hypothetical protein
VSVPHILLAASLGVIANPITLRSRLIRMAPLRVSATEKLDFNITREIARYI